MGLWRDQSITKPASLGHGDPAQDFGGKERRKEWREGGREEGMRKEGRRQSVLAYSGAREKEKHKKAERNGRKRLSIRKRLGRVQENCSRLQTRMPRLRISRNLGSHDCILPHCSDYSREPVVIFSGSFGAR